MEPQSKAEDMLVENGNGHSASAWIQEHSPRAVWRYVFREDRLFLILSVFIGVFSGLAVVCFRFAIDWARLYLLLLENPAPVSGFHDSPSARL